MPGSGTAHEERPIEKPALFISRAGPDASIAARICGHLEAAGYRVVLQDQTFGNRNFIDAMHQALASQARLVALLSPAYLESDYCAAEWENAIAGDPLNRHGRLVILRVAECQPVGLLAGLAYRDVSGVLDDPESLGQAVREALQARNSLEELPARGHTRTESLPTGVVTFLVTEIEGSAKLWDRYRGAMRKALGRHDSLMLAAVARHGGYVVRSSDGSFCAVFAAAESALEAACEAQQMLRVEDFSVIGGLGAKMAIHTGSAIVLGDNYVGPTLNRALRLLALGHAGQVLVSATAAELTADTLPQDIRLLELGRFELPDLAHPERIFLVSTPGLLSEPLPLHARQVTPNNLPVQVSRFVGRTHEIAEISQLVTEARLVTLTGTGGVGKTRTALEIAGRLFDQSPDGVWLAELAALSDESLVAGVISSAMGLGVSERERAREVLLVRLKGRRITLVLDTCEHVLAEVATIAATILRTCPNVRVLATSREALGIDGEEIYPLPPLSIPPAAGSETSDSILQYDATALLVERARAVDKGFALTERNAHVVAEIVRRLDGIPLAIELAAARMRSLGVEGLSQHLDRRLSLLTAGRRATLPRQQTMRALIDWSYSLLAEAEKALFRRLAIFAGGCSLESAAAVCAQDSSDEMTFVDLLSSLVGKSLLNVEVSSRGPRYHFLESTREYAFEKLKAAGEYESAASEHAAAYLALAEHLDETWSITPERDWNEQVTLELENWRTALEWTLGKGSNPLTGQQLVGALIRMTMFTPGERKRWLRAAMAAVAENLTVPPRLHLCDAQLSAMLYQWRSVLAAAERALGGFRAEGDERQAAEAARYRGYALVLLGNVAEGKDSLQRALDAYRRLGARRAEAGVLQDLADAENREGNLERARPIYAEALALFKACGAQERPMQIARNVAEAEFRGGNVDEAIRLATDVLVKDRKINDPLYVANDLVNLCAYLIAQGRFAEASELSGEALSIARSARLDVLVAVAFQHLAALAALAPEPDASRTAEKRRRAARLLGYVDERLRALEVSRQYTEQQEHEKIMRALREAFNPTELSELLQVAQTWDEARAALEASQSEVW